MVIKFHTDFSANHGGCKSTTLDDLDDLALCFIGLTHLAHEVFRSPPPVWN